MKKKLPKISLGFLITVAGIALVILLIHGITEKKPSNGGATPANKTHLTCTQLYGMGIHDIRKGTSDYRVDLDRDSDGIACET